MTPPRTAALLRHLHGLTALHDNDRLADGELVRRFLTERDEGAFAALLRRHGAMVLRVCRGVLRHEADAEDAFQATFLVFARKAASLRSYASVGCWLHGVARRVALKARAGTGRRRGHEERAARVPPGEPDVLAHVAGREAEHLVDEELDRLPEKYRMPIILCCLEGKSRDEAARLLGWSAGLVKSRLEEARGLLRRRLARRGLAPALLASALARQTASAVTPALGTATVRSALSAAGGVVPAPAAALAEEVMRAMWLSKVKLAAAVLFATCLVGAGGVVAHRTLSAGEAETSTREQVKEPAPPGPRWQRAVRWKLNFNTADGEDYARQLHALGATVAVPEGDGETRYRVYRDLGRRPAKGTVEDLGKSDRLFWLDDRPQSLAALGEALGWKNAPKHLVVFFPPFVEDELLRKELAFGNRKEEEIAETEFRIRRTVRGYDVEVTSQRRKDDSAGVSLVLRVGTEEKHERVADVLEALKKVGVTRMELEFVGERGFSAVLRAPGATPYATVEKVIRTLKGAGVKQIDAGVDP